MECNNHFEISAGYHRLYINIVANLQLWFKSVRTKIHWQCHTYSSVNENQSMSLPRFQFTAIIILYSTIYGRSANLTLNVRVPSYLGLTRSISWLLMPWLLMSRAHQQPWYVEYVEYVGSGLTWGRILSICVISMWSNDIKCKYMFYFPSETFST